MFDIGWSELLVIGVVALIAIGPRELPGVLRTVGLWVGKVRRMAAEFQGQFQEAMREAEMADLKKEVDSIGDTARDLASGIDSATRIENPTAPVATSGPIAAGPPAPLVTESAANAAVPLPAPAEQQPQPAPDAVSPSPAAASAPPLDLNLPPPEPIPPLSDKDFAAAPAVPPHKAGEGGA